MSERAGIATMSPPGVAWPPDDTEESVLGTNLHQTAITNLRTGINESAVAAVPEGGAVPWQAGGQTMIRGWRRWDGTAYTTLPDVFVYRKPWDDERGSLHLAIDGPPVLIVEVLSKETYKADLNLEQGKGYSYRVAGVAEYLTLDPAHRYAPDGGLGWQLVDGVYRPWRPDRSGHWRSTELGIAIALEGAMVAVYGPDGRRQLREGEVSRELARRDAELARLRAELERLRQEHDDTV
jgi:hypothetical protein